MEKYENIHTFWMIKKTTKKKTKKNKKKNKKIFADWLGCNCWTAGGVQEIELNAHMVLNIVQPYMKSRSRSVTVNGSWQGAS